MPTLENWQLDLQGILRQAGRVKVVYVCSPDDDQPGNYQSAGFSYPAGVNAR
ncbi:hypothetical protein ACLK1T_24060 [Escherichia coli]